MFNFFDLILKQEIKSKSEKWPQYSTVRSEESSYVNRKLQL